MPGLRNNDNGGYHVVVTGTKVGKLTGFGKGVAKTFIQAKQAGVKQAIRFGRRTAGNAMVNVVPVDPDNCCACRHFQSFRPEKKALDFQLNNFGRFRLRLTRPMMIVLVMAMMMVMMMAVSLFVLICGFMVVPLTRFGIVVVAMAAIICGSVTMPMMSMIMGCHQAGEPGFGRQGRPIRTNPGQKENKQQEREGAPDQPLALTASRLCPGISVYHAPHSLAGGVACATPPVVHYLLKMGGELLYDSLSQGIGDHLHVGIGLTQFAVGQRCIPLSLSINDGD
jgi:hypothetical protein